MAKKMFGEETKSKKKSAKATATKPVKVKRAYTRRKGIAKATAKGEVQLVTIQVPAQVAFQLGMHLGALSVQN